MKPKYVWATLPIILTWVLLMGLLSDKYDPTPPTYSEVH